MKVSFTILAVLAAALAVNASNPHDGRALISRHTRISHRAPTLVNRSVKRKRCKARPTPVNNGAAVDTTTTTSKPKPTSVKPTASPKPQPPAPQSFDNGGVLNVKSSCGNIGAIKQTTRTSGPNGNIDWLNCGVTSGGWNPPFIKVSDIKSVSLSGAINSGKGPFLACTKYVHLFEKYAGQYGLPPIMLAAFAMQESSCNPNTVGGGGEQGLMQITKEKCGGAPGGNCRDPDFNIRTGARYFADTLNNNGGNLLLSIGSYNGWFEGLTYGKATAAAKSACCKCQNNLDYLHQFLNGWLQNIDAYSQSFRLGKFFNLDVCN
ncbi:Membrane-bound lytic murein transglycosylase F [Hypsizygus marmoreus]|uniref:Membrane-bound lytic murein transglycosylase F n=1 Tax=Hypsizygus marmoreus TaxID=39966 RepID=A0A369JY68_HYPMA|nr:Membrane-bound lytic murein transglycosylase F [Hypsizygus marmoreus]